MGALSDESRQSVVALSTQVREQEGKIKSLEEELKTCQALLVGKDMNLQVLTKAMTLVRSGDPVVRARLDSPLPAEGAADTV